MKIDNERIIGEKIILRPITFDDTNLIVKWRNNPQVKENFIFQEAFTTKIHETWMKTKVITGEVCQYIIEDKNNNPIGSVYYRDIDETNKSAEFGIFIGEDSARGIGLGSEATKMFINFGFNKLNLHRIMLRVLQENIRAYSSYLKVGFEVEGIFKDMVRLNGTYHNIVFMSIIK